MADNTNREDLDWDSLSNPVPIDLVDEGFETATSHSSFPVRVRRCSRAPNRRPWPKPSRRSPFGKRPCKCPGTARPSRDRMPRTTSDARSFVFALRWRWSAAATAAPSDDNASGSGGTTFGINWPREEAAIQDEFSRIRANMEAEAEAERKAKAEAEKEEAGQRQRLEQWIGERAQAVAEGR